MKYIKRIWHITITVLLLSFVVPLIAFYHVVLMGGWDEQTWMEPFIDFPFTPE